tara:strand:+ start:507 stop:818 length:312 start_codon:yes stop_codon:yes gene_type:complete
MLIRRAPRTLTVSVGGRKYDIERITRGEALPMVYASSISSAPVPSWSAVIAIDDDTIPPYFTATFYEAGMAYGGATSPSSAGIFQHIRGEFRDLVKDALKAYR